MQLAEHFIGNGHPVTKVLRLLDIPSSSYYYIPKVNGRKKGRIKSQKTKVKQGQYVSNAQVVKEIETYLSKEFVDYGYRKITHWLRQVKNYIINEKKVYRLMKENGLLRSKNRYKRLSPRQWVRDIVPQPSQCFEYLEIDIKYIWIDGVRRNALLLSVIDVESRWVLGQYMDWRITKENVVELFEQIFNTYSLPKKMYVRNDNGSQFVATMVQLYFEDKRNSSFNCVWVNNIISLIHLSFCASRRL